MPMYQVKPSRTIEHNNRCYSAGEVVELPSNLGAFHEPNIVPYVISESIETTVDVKNIASEDVFPKSVEFEEDSEDEEETDEEEKSIFI